MRSAIYWALAALLLPGAGAFAQGTTDLDKLYDVNYVERYTALTHIVANPQNLQEKSVREALIDCQERENGILLRMTPGSPQAEDEGYGDTYLSLLGETVLRIAQATDDQRAYNALAGSGYNSDSALGKILASRVQDLPALIEVVQKPEFVEGVSETIKVIGMVLRKSKDGSIGPLGSDEYLRAKNAILDIAVSRDRSDFVRAAAVDALGIVGDSSDIPLLRRIAQTDKGVTDGPDGSRVFYLRKEVEKAIASMSPARR